MGFSQIAATFVAFWIILYASVYVLFLSPHLNEIKDKEPIDRTLNSNIEVNNGPLTVTKVNPFVSDVCKEFAYGTKIKSVAVIIAARNEEKKDLIRTVESLLKYSGPSLRKVLVVDDDSETPISSWSEWSNWSEASAAQEILGSIHLTTRQGVSGAKNAGAEHIIDKVDVLIFLDAHCVVSKGWLAPILHTLEKNPNAIVYPAIDIIDEETDGFIQADNMIGAFDWAMNFRWESPNILRTPLSPESVGPYDDTFSPATPGIFAIRSKYFNDIGGLNPNLRNWGQENIELSIRVWLCGGVIIRQPCSRVAHKYKHLNKDRNVGNGITQQMVDRNVMSIAEAWLSEEHKETVFQARFTGRVPYQVEVSLDARFPQHLQSAPLVSKDICQRFEWFLKEVYPGLLVDLPDIETFYRHHLVSGYLKKDLEPLLTQYNKKSAHAFNPKEIERLALKEKEAKEELKRQSEIMEKQIASINKINKKKPKEALVKEELDGHGRHAQKVRDELLCEDELLKNPDGCKVSAGLGDCSKRPSYMMFGCPKSCGLCGKDGLLCQDFYIKKCPVWKEEGQCSTNEKYMNTNCRRTCGRCQLAGKSLLDSPAATADSPLVEEGEKKPLPAIVKPQVPLVKKTNSIPLKKEPLTDYFNPYVLQQRTSSGSLIMPDPTVKNACGLKSTADGQLLDKVKLDRSKDIAKVKPNDGLKLFCGVYTMEDAHSTNAEATRSTWGKRCTGFVAFSTISDPLFPAMKIEHEGPETYNNMWQKSRSIWKYIATHYLEEFDWFLMGGDDMFYIIENLRNYLDSDEIHQAQEKGKGLFIGRRFFPPGQVVFNSGGAGYLLDKKALIVLRDNIDTPKCYPHQEGFWEDVNIANCLKKGGDIVPYDTRDSQKRERFHPFTPGHHLTYRKPQNNPESDWYVKYNPELKIGFDCCSDTSISFHYAKDDVLKNLAAYVYHCDKKDAASI